MKKIASSIIIAVFVLGGLFSSGVFAGGGAPGKVTGGGEMSAGSVDFSLTASGQVKFGETKGEMQYGREGQSVPDLSMHAKVHCMSFWGDFDEAVIAGPVKAQHDPAGFIDEGDWMVVAVKEGGIGEGDRARVRIMSEGDAQGACFDRETSFPGYMHDGNFNITSMSRWAL